MMILSRRLTSDQGLWDGRFMARAAEGRMRHRTMAEYALAELREAIILGELPAGTPLRLDELARSLGMSISPIREAVRQLEALGLAKHVPHQGARVLDFDIDELRGEGDVRQTMRAHTDFHFTLYEASQSSWLVSLIRPAWDRSERFRPALFTAENEPQVRHRELDGRLLAACEEHDPAAAAQALYEHLELASLFFETELAGEGIFARGA
jgi:DNA-binding GntR family transcriptional regulator